VDPGGAGPQNFFYVLEVYFQASPMIGCDDFFQVLNQNKIMKLQSIVSMHNCVTLLSVYSI